MSKTFEIIRLILYYLILFFRINIVHLLYYKLNHTNCVFKYYLCNRLEYAQFPSVNSINSIMLYSHCMYVCEKRERMREKEKERELYKLKK